MPNQCQTINQLLAEFADNTTGKITAQFGRNLIISSIAYITGYNPTPNNDNTDSAGIGQFFDAGNVWVNNMSNQIFWCVNGTTANAVWVSLGGLTLNPGNNIGPSITFAADYNANTWSVSGANNTITYHLPYASQNTEGILNTTVQTLKGSKTLISDTTTNPTLTLQQQTNQNQNLFQIVDA
jgi:hypothetical protein